MQYSYSGMLGTKTQRRAALLLLFFFALLFLSELIYSAATRENASSVAYPASDQNFHYSDYPGSFLPAVASSVLPGINCHWSEQAIEIANSKTDYVQLMPEHEAYPILEHKDKGAARSFQTVYRATVVIASDKERIKGDIYSWSELNQHILGTEELGLLIRPEYILAALDQDGSNKEAAQVILANLAEIHTNDKLRIFSGAEANTAWPSSLSEGEFKPEDLPGVLILWDYQAAQLNLRSGTNRYQIHVPSEGSIFVDYGFFASGSRPTELVNYYLAAGLADAAASKLLDFGYRLIDGRSPANPVSIYEHSSDPTRSRRNNLGYPPETEYRLRQERVKNYTSFNQRFMDNKAMFSRAVLKHNLWIPANGEEEQFLMILSIPLFLIWIASIYYRLDDDSCKRSMSLLLLSLGVWIFVHFMQVMYRGSMSVSSLDYLRFIPMFSACAAFFHAAICLAHAKGYLSLFRKRLAYLVIILCLVIGALLARDYAAEAFFTVDGLGRIARLKPAFYMAFAFVLLVIMGAMKVLRRCQLRQGFWRSFPPYFVLFLTFAYNAFFFAQHYHLRSGNYDLLNSLLTVAFLETCLATRLLSVNYSYFKLFRHSPVNLRLLSEDMTSIYPQEREQLAANTLLSIKEKLTLSFPQHKQKTSLLTLFPWRQDAEEQQDWRIRINDLNNPDLYFGASKLSGGYLLWEENLSALNHLRNSLSQISEQLLQQGRVIENEKNIRSQYLSMRIRRRLLDDIEKSLSAKMDEIKASLRALQDRNIHNEPACIKRELGRVKLMVSQCKRKSNLLLRGEDSIALEELRLIFQEALSDAQTAGISGFAVCQGEGNLAIRTVLFLYDYTQQVLQRSAGIGKSQNFIIINKSRRNLQYQLIFSSEAVAKADIFSLNEEQAGELRNIKGEYELNCEDSDWRIRLNFALDLEGSEDV